MSTAVWHELGPAGGSCTVCGTSGRLRLGEARSRLSVLERVRREPCSPPARFVVCGGCGWRWSVRAHDLGVEGVRRRRRETSVPPDARAGSGEPVVSAAPVVSATPVVSTSPVEAPSPVEPDGLPEDRRCAAAGPRSASRTVLPAPRGERRFGRDWTYPTD